VLHVGVLLVQVLLARACGIDVAADV
jgi:hypothetical protein